MQKPLECLPTSAHIGCHRIIVMGNGYAQGLESAGGFEADANNLLRALRPEDYALLEPHLELRSAGRGTVLHEPGDLAEFAHFPCGAALASCVVVLSSGASVETALIGREGAVGGIVSQGHLPAHSRAVVILGGDFLRVELAALEEAKRRSVTLRHLFARYADCLLAQIFQSVALQCGAQDRAAGGEVSADNDGAHRR